MDFIAVCSEKLQGLPSERLAARTDGPEPSRGCNWPAVLPEFALVSFESSPEDYMAFGSCPCRFELP